MNRHTVLEALTANHHQLTSKDGVEQRNRGTSVQLFQGEKKEIPKVPGPGCGPSRGWLELRAELRRAARHVSS